MHAAAMKLGAWYIVVSDVASTAVYAPSHDLPRLQLVVASSATPRCDVLSCGDCCCAGDRH
jgi:hypothetical protein